MRGLLISISVLLQVLVLAYIGGQREYVLRTGRTLYLRTAPVDPRDLFRGDYVRLDYDISTVAREKARDGLAKIDNKTRGKRGCRVYAVLDVDENNLGSVRYLTDKRPSGQPYIRGRLNTVWGGGSFDVDYGIEAYFVEQDKAKELEIPRRYQKAVVPLEMGVRLGENGIAVLKDHRYSPLAFDIQFDRVSVNRKDNSPAGVVVRIINVSEKELAIVGLPGGRSLWLEPDNIWHYGEKRWEWVNRDAQQARQAVEKVKNSDVCVLQPGEHYEVFVNMRDPWWFVEYDKDTNKTPRSIIGSSDDRWQGAGYRFIYRSPSKEQCSHLDKADLIWYGYLSSQVLYITDLEEKPDGIIFR